MNSKNLVKPQKSSKGKAGLKAVFLAVVVLVMAISLPACSSSSSSPAASQAKEEKNTTPLSADETKSMLADANSYKDRTVEKLPGVVFNVVSSTPGDYQYQCWADANHSQSFVITSKEDLKLTAAGLTGDNVFVTGVVTGQKSATNAFGTPLSLAVIEVTSVEKSGVSVFNLAQETLEVGQTLEQYGITVTLHKIELAQTVTRVYFTVNNGTGDKISVYTFDSYLKKGTTQYDDHSTYGEQGSLKTDVNSGIETTGWVSFQKLDSLSGGVTVSLRISSNDYMNVGRYLEPFVFTVGG